MRLSPLPQGHKLISAIRRFYPAQQAKQSKRFFFEKRGKIFCTFAARVCCLSDLSFPPVATANKNLRGGTQDWLSFRSASSFGLPFRNSSGSSFLASSGGATISNWNGVTLSSMRKTAITASKAPLRPASSGSKKIRIVSSRQPAQGA
jgi:hypothetical protein